jgi:hypothetical protein
MSLLDTARKRVQAVLDEINRIAQYEFPYKASGDALKKVEQVFTARLASLNALNDQSDPGVVRQTCSLGLRDITVYLPLLGFIVRSTNVRNSFEIFRPLLRMARAVLEPNTPKGQPQQTQLVVSSEWQYSPFVFREVPGLLGFVLIGLPAAESPNPLLVPLAGHELGHSVWASSNSGVRGTLAPAVVGEILTVIRGRWAEYGHAFPHVNITPAQLDQDLAAIGTWMQAANWAFEQTEETFCDCLGIRLFGKAYLEAFGYLLAPVIPGHRTFGYPGMLARVGNMVTAAAAYGADVPASYQTQFDAEPLPAMPPQATFLLSVADQALTNLLDTIIREADRVVAASCIPQSDRGQVERIYARFKMVVPAERCLCLADILNAAWRAFRDSTFWQGDPQIGDKKDDILKELVLKNIELFEIQQILESQP